MKKIKIFDTTLRDGEQSPGCTMYLNEKLEIAYQLEKMKVDVIEAGFAASSAGDFEAVSEIARRIKDSAITSLSRALRSDIDATYAAVKYSQSPRIHIFLATSQLHMQYKLKKSPEQVIELIHDSVKYAKTLCSDIEFSAEDFSRSEPEFVCRALKAAIDAGATVINCPDTVGYSTPAEMAAKVKYLIDNIPGIERAEISAHNHNDLGMAVANSLAMIQAGATQIECTINGIGERAGNTSLEEAVMALKVRRDLYNCYTDIVTGELYKASKMISKFTGVKIHPSKAIVGANAFAHESGIHQHGVLANPETYEIMKPEDIGIPQNKIVLGKHSGKHAFSEHLNALGYALTVDEISRLFAEFKKLCDKKKYVSNKDIEALISNNAPTGLKFALINYKIKSGKKSGAEAILTLNSENGVKQCGAKGDGPVDASYNAINSLLERDYILDDYSLNSVTEGRDAMAEATIRLNFADNTANGRGVSTDVIEASILAYLDAVNKLG